MKLRTVTFKGLVPHVEQSWMLDWLRLRYGSDVRGFFALCEYRKDA